MTVIDTHLDTKHDEIDDESCEAGGSSSKTAKYKVPMTLGLWPDARKR